VSALPAAGRLRPRSAVRLWWLGARPRTLGVGAVPVLVGATVSAHPRVAPTLAALAVALALQVGANYANDYFDGVRGIDTVQRTGPTRLTASGLVPPEAVLGAALGCLAVAAGLGSWLALSSGLGWLLLAGAAALAAALLYTGGPRPYASDGIVADLAVFGFFGLMAVAGTAAVQGGSSGSGAWWAGAAVGLLAVAVLEANNLRDLATDAAAGRRTLVVRLGDRRARLLDATLVLAGALAVPVAGVAVHALPLPALLTLAAAPALVAPLRLLCGTGRAGRGLAPLLPLSARLHLASGVMLALGLVIARSHDTPAWVGLACGLALAAGLAAADLLPRP
jgi:1,4-dihydroxy-2-naphthoate octaprenyltransferase